MTSAKSSSAGLSLVSSRDPLKSLTKYIRVRSDADASLVEFDFAIDDPSLFVELIMPRGAFEAFCAANEVVHMTPEQMEMIDAEMEKWRYGKDTLVGRNHSQAHAQESGQ